MLLGRSRGRSDRGGWTLRDEERGSARVHGRERTETALGARGVEPLAGRTIRSRQVSNAVIEERDGGLVGEEQGRLGGVARLHQHFVRLDAHRLEQRDEQDRLVVAIALSPREQLLRPVGEPPFAGHVVDVADVVGDEFEDRLHLVVARFLPLGEIGGHSAHLIVGLGEALDGALVPLAELFPARERGADDGGKDLARPRSERLVGYRRRVVPDHPRQPMPVFGLVGEPIGLTVQDVDRERLVGGRIHDHLVIEEGMGGERSRIVDEIEGRIAAAPDRAAGPRADRDLHHVPGFEVGPADGRPPTLGLLLLGERDAARCSMHARAQNFGVVPFRRDRLVKLVLRARLDDHLARVLDHLRNAPVGVERDGAHPVQLAVEHLALFGGGLFFAGQEHRRLDHVLGVGRVVLVGRCARTAFARSRPRKAARDFGAVRHLRAVLDLRRFELARSLERANAFLVRPTSNLAAASPENAPARLGQRRAAFSKTARASSCSPALVSVSASSSSSLPSVRAPDASASAAAALTAARPSYVRASTQFTSRASGMSRASSPLARA